MKDITSVIGGLFRCGFRSLVTYTTIGLVSLFIMTSPAKALETYNEVSYEDIALDLKPPVAPSEREIQCLAKNIYFEARGESYLGQKAVAFVTLNRVRSGTFPDNICDVVYQRHASSCQFHWACKRNVRVIDFEAFEQARLLAIKVITMYNQISDPSKGALYFHAKAVQTTIRSSRTTATIGQHRFYK